MESLKDSSISQVKGIPGLYISDRFAACSRSLLASLNVGYVLSVTRTEDVPKFTEDRIAVKHIDIDDDPTEDILCHLDDACDWIDAALHSSTLASEVDNFDSVWKHPRSGVVVHCTQGISRSSSFIIAYLMRTLTLSYDTALSLARESRSLVTPNPGFERQLRIWEECQYEVYTCEPATASTPYLPPVEKPAYKVWKQQRDDLFCQRTEDVNKIRASTMASMAAQFRKEGKRIVMGTMEWMKREEN
ncbi:phosphatases II [Zopfia rhizophila CBS 207.26]|uniref:protein-tyrosine-phosphatase n=1 Tax=Zopfia rhizophila CBS 207.26 TaxID=1314779 RepID=A0A6A6DZ78_9PEZI|nr:phosphatases II [Zopfia rhizophila CBS 207.26]